MIGLLQVSFHRALKVIRQHILRLRALFRLIEMHRRSLRSGLCGGLSQIEGHMFTSVYVMKQEYLHPQPPDCTYLGIWKRKYLLLTVF